MIRPCPRNIGQNTGRTGHDNEYHGDGTLAGRITTGDSEARREWLFDVPACTATDGRPLRVRRAEFPGGNFVRCPDLEEQHDRHRRPPELCVGCRVAAQTRAPPTTADTC
jgi:hypothetical protein